MNNINNISIHGQGQLHHMRRQIPEAYQEVARGMETEFINFMLEKMSSTVSPSKETSTGMNFYRSMQDYERAKIMALKDGGVGLQKLILDQIYPQTTSYNRNKVIQDYQKQAAQPVEVRRE